MTAFLQLCLLALALDASANPVPVPTPPPLDVPSACGHSSQAAPTCTTTLTQLILGFQGDWTPEIAKTVYTTTETVYSRVPCDGCALSITAKLANFYGGPGPVEIVTGTTTAEEPFRTTLTVCSADPTVPAHVQIPRRGLGNNKIREGGVGPRAETLSPTTGSPTPSSECTHTMLATPSYLHISDKTRIIYTDTATTTSHIDCSGCSHLEVKTVDFLHPGPVIHLTTTETAETAKTLTEYVCLKTPSVINPSTLRTLPVQPTASVASLLKQRDDAPPACHNSEDATVLVTITRTVYTATVTAVRTATCGPVDADGPPGGIPRHHHHQRDDDDDGKGPGEHRTRTRYTTEATTASGTWTRTSFHCAGGLTAGFSRPGGARPTPGRIAGGEKPNLQQAAAAAETKPPPPPPSPANPTRVTSTINVGG